MSSSLYPEQSSANAARLLQASDRPPTSGTRVRRNDFKTIYRDHASFVLNVVCGHTGCDRPTGEELMQEVFMRAWRKLNSYHHQCRIRTWLYSFARNVSREHIRKESRYRFQADTPIADSKPPAWGRVPTDEEHRMNARQTVHFILEQMAEPKRELLIMSCLAGMRITEIAEYVGGQYDTVRKRRDAARREFIRTYTRYFGTEGALQW